MEPGFLRTPVAMLAAVAILCAGCAPEQRVAFREPAGADGRTGGDRSRAHGGGRPGRKR